VYDEEASGLGKGGLDLLGRYRFDNSMVTIYIDSCRKVEQWCDVPLDQLLHVVLVHELAHLMTHRGFGAQESLSPHFWEYTAQCATYAYLHRHNAEALKVFKKLSPYQPFIYQTWESLEALRAPSGDKFEALVKDVFSAFAKESLDPPVVEIEDMHEFTGWNE
jgi:predicted Zn-dependent protease with MMP-like domain